MICKICAQAIDSDNQKDRRKLKNYTDEEYQVHLVDYHGYQPPDVPPPPPLNNQELTDELAKLRKEYEDFVTATINVIDELKKEIDSRVEKLERSHKGD